MIDREAKEKLKQHKIVTSLSKYGKEVFVVCFKFSILCFV